MLYELVVCSSSDDEDVRVLLQDCISEVIFVATCYLAASRIVYPGQFCMLFIVLVCIYKYISSLRGRDDSQEEPEVPDPLQLQQIKTNPTKIVKAAVSPPKFLQAKTRAFSPKTDEISVPLRVKDSNVSSSRQVAPEVNLPKKVEKQASGSKTTLQVPVSAPKVLAEPPRQRMVPEQASSSVEAAREKEAKRQKAKDMKLDVLAKTCSKRVNTASLSSAWTKWQRITIDRLMRTKKKKLQLVFGVWRRQLEKIYSRRAKLDTQLMAINFHNSTPKRNKRTRLGQVIRSKARHRHQHDSLSFEMRFVSIFGGQKTLLSSAKRNLFLYAGPDSPFMSPHFAVGPGLLERQTRHFREELGVRADADEAGGALRQVWPQDLFFHLGVLTSCSGTHGTAPSGKKWDHSHCLLPNIFRALLSSGSGDASSSTTMGSFDGSVPCFIDQSGPHSRRVHMRVDEYFARDESSPEPLLKGPDKLSAALVVVPDVVRFLDDIKNSSSPRRNEVANHKMQECSLFSEVLLSSQRTKSDSLLMNEESLLLAEKYLSDIVDACVPLTQHNTPVVLVISTEFLEFDVSTTTASITKSSLTRSKSDNVASFEEITDPSQCSTLSIFLRMLSQRSGANVPNVIKAFTLEAMFLTSDLYDTR